MPRFVILTHDWPHLHWDFMLEQGNSLKTWRLESEPVLDTWIKATPLPDHRIEYLDYEGAVSQNRGTVSRYLQGTYNSTEQFPKENWVRLGGDFGIWDARIIEEWNGTRFLFSQPSI